MNTVAAPPATTLTAAAPKSARASLTTPAFLTIMAALVLTAWTPDLLGLPGGLSLYYVVLSGAFLLVAARARRLQPPLDRTQSALLRPIIYAALFIALWAVLGTFQAADPLRVGRPVTAFLFGPILLFVMNRMVRVADEDRILEWFFYCAAASALVSLAAIFWKDLGEIIFGERDRAQAFFKHPNQFGIALCTVAPILIAKLMTDTRGRIKYAAMLALVILGLVLAGSKANTLIIAIAGVLIALFNAFAQRSVVRSLFFLLFFAVAAVAVGVVFWELIMAFNPRMGMLISRLASGEETHSIIGRYYIWDLSIEQFWADPLFGQGGGALLDLGIDDEDRTHSHNVVLDLMRTLGVPGLLAIMTFAIGLFVLAGYHMLLAATMRNVDRSELLKLSGLTLGMLCYFVSNMSSDSMGPSSAPIFWTVLALALFQANRVRFLGTMHLRPKPAIPVRRFG